VQVEVHRLVWFVGILSFTVAMLLFVIGLIRKTDPLNAFVNGFILVVVANVPEVSTCLVCCDLCPLPLCVALLKLTNSKDHKPAHKASSQHMMW
jgi:hypothetical protein